MKRGISIIITAGIILIVSSMLYVYFDRHSHQAKGNRATDASSSSNVPEVSVSDKEETPVNEETWEKVMKDVKAEQIEKISTFVQGKECFSSNQKRISRVKEVLSRLARKEPPKENGKYEGGWTTFQIYGEDGLLYSLDMLNMHEGAIAYIKKGEETLCCDISASDEKFLHDLYKRFYDKYAVDVDDE